MATQMVGQAGGSSLFGNSSSFGIGEIYGLPDLSKAEIAAPRLIMLANVALTTDVSNGCCDYALEEDRQMAELTTVYDNSFSDSEADRMDMDESILENEEPVFEPMVVKPVSEEEEKIDDNPATPHVDDDNNNNNKNNEDDDENVETEPEKNAEVPPVAEEKSKTVKNKPFQCRPCQYKAETEEEFVHHIKDHSAKRFIDNDKNSQESGSCSSEEVDISKGPIRCDRCGYNTNRIDHYLAHLKHHNKVAENERVYKCTICTYTTVSEYHWKKHLRNHFPRIVYTCSQCSYFSDRKNNYIQHIRTHTGERPYQCLMCPYSSSQKTHLTRHMRTHSGEKPFKCEQCNYVASNQHEVTRHARQLHNGPKPLTCPHCNYKTADRSNFRKHVELHVNPRQFMCPVCNYAASKKCNLQYHIKSRHSGCTDITMDVSKVKLRTKKDISATDLNESKQEEKENSEGRTESAESKTDQKNKVEKEKCATLKSASNGQMTTCKSKQPLLKAAEDTSSGKSALKARNAKRKFSSVAEKPLKTNDTQNTSVKKSKTSQASQPVRKEPKKGKKTGKCQKQKSITKGNQKKIVKNKPNKANKKAITENASRKVKNVPVDGKKTDTEVPQNQSESSSDIPPEAEPAALIAANSSAGPTLIEINEQRGEPNTEKENNLNNVSVSDIVLNPCPMEGVESSELLEQEMSLNEEDMADKTDTSETPEAEKNDMGPEPLADVHTSNCVSPAEEPAVVAELTEHCHEPEPLDEHTSACDSNSQAPDLEHNELQPLENKENDSEIPNTTSAADDHDVEGMVHSQCDLPSNVSFDGEEDEGIHSHEGSEISDSVSERSDDSGLNGVQSSQDTLDPKPTPELPIVESSISTESFVCIFCDRTFKKSEEYTKHLKRHLVNVYYLEKAAQDRL
ncbi:RE1-silencing transcription factor [Gastrophryne carolinensis]